jgi:hypothetical protein
VNRQKGVTITGLLTVCVLLFIVLLLAFKVVPVYIEYRTIQSHFRGMADDPSLRAVRRSELDRSWAARTSIDDIKSLPAESIEYTKEGEGWVISADYSVKVPLVRNISACFDFHPTSKQ